MLRTGPRRVAATLLVVGAGTAAIVPAATAAPQRAALPGPLGGVVGNLPIPVPQLDPTALQTLLGQAAAQDPTGTLPAVVAQLTPEQITGLIGSGTGVTEVLDGLGSIVDSLLAGEPSTGQIDAVVEQVTALLAGGLPTDPAQIGQLQAILEDLPGLLGTPGLDPAALNGLQGTLASLLGIDPAQLPGGGQAVGTLSSALAGVLGTSSSSPGAGGGSGATRPVGTAPAPAATTTGPTARNTRFRVRLSGVRVLRGNRAVRLTVTCPAAAPFCATGLTAQARGGKSKARVIGLRAGESQTLRLRLPRAVTRSLRARGGRVKVTAVTAGSTLPAVVKRPRARRAESR